MLLSFAPPSQVRNARVAAPIWTHLVAFALSIVIPLWALLGYIAWASLQREQSDYQAQTMVAARSLAVDLDRELSSFSAMLRVLAAAPLLEDGDLQRFHGLAKQVLPPGSALVLRDRSGQQLVNTLFPFGTPLPVTRSVAVLAADRCVFETQAICASDLYTGTTDSQPYVLLDAPVFRDGKVAYAVNVAVSAKHLAAVLAAYPASPGWVLSIIDRQGRIVARSSEHERFVGSLANEALRAKLNNAEGSLRTINVAGVPVWGAYVRFPTWDWQVAIGVPEAVLEAPVRQSVLYFGGTGVAAVGLSIVAAVLYGGRIARSIGLLSRLAGHVGDATPLRTVRTGVQEVNQVAAKLAEASARLDASTAERDRAQAALQRLNTVLEARVEAEVAAREEVQAKALQVQRIQALGQLAGGIAHDFNNVLQATTGCAATIIKRADDPEAVRRFGNLLINAAARGTSVTRRLLSFAGHSELCAETIDLPFFFAGLQEVLSHTLGTHIAVCVDIRAPLPPVFADRGQLETVLVNLATNARDAMQAGGQLLFAVAAHNLPDTQPPPGPLRPGSYVCITVSDTGSGMDAATLARATEPFFTTKGRGEGNGLGLSMARGFAEQSAGSLVLESTPGVGTTVRMWLPARPGACAEPLAVAGPAQASMARQLRVLLVEDEAIVRETIAIQLGDEGHQVLAARDASEALAILDTEDGIDAIVTDLNMPGMNGLDLIRAIRQRGWPFPAILLTGNAEEGKPLAHEGAAALNFSVLRKPIFGAALAHRLSSLVTTTGA